MGESPLLLVADAVDHVLLVDGVPTLFVADAALSLPLPPVDETGRVDIDITIGNEDKQHTARFAVLRGSAVAPVAIARWYDDAGVLDVQATLELQEPRAVGAGINASLRSENDEDVPAHPLTHTLENTPTIRGMQ